MGTGEEPLLLKSKAAESMVRTDGIVDALPGTELTVVDG